MSKIRTPPNPYDNLPPVGTVQEERMGQGGWAALTADYLNRREEFERGKK